jgi:hypothetical protein
MREKIIAIVVAVSLLVIAYVLGYRAAEMKYEDVSIFTYAPDSINS